jgi:hypothetical protein
MIRCGNENYPDSVGEIIGDKALTSALYNFPKNNFAKKTWSVSCARSIPRYSTKTSWRMALSRG